ncbi:MAG: hypothetical protein LUQ50_14325 [Methanospirillum sp.]|uniref:hypothetical protein n=1 Tax=Methanospirillum sp. TaxID=45200 RepID=UPI002375EBE4|nr:hypothetical protein [Methanospirillum sp.]MDD1730231.1 hypothetical protein [Methanospirillum sp.]
MRLAEFFETDEARLVEPLFSDLCYTEMDELLMNIPAERSRILIDENEEVLSVGLESADGGIQASCFHLRTPSETLLSRLEEMDGDIFQIPRRIFEDTIRRYYSDTLITTSVMASNDLNPERLSITRDLISSVVANEQDLTCLDCCCGTGIGSYLMRDMGLNPLSYDNDDALLARGLSEGRLLPERTMWIDGRLLDAYLTEPVDCAFGFMFGELQSFNHDIWSEIVSVICEVSERTLITVGTEPEAAIIREWMQDAGKNPEIWENDKDPIYDRWVCSAD